MSIEQGLSKGVKRFFTQTKSDISWVRNGHTWYGKKYVPVITELKIIYHQFYWNIWKKKRKN